MPGGTGIVKIDDRERRGRVVDFSRTLSTLTTLTHAHTHTHKSARRTVVGTEYEINNIILILIIIIRRKSTSAYELTD